MNQIIIKNVGPIENIQIDLKKINVIMGPQSSGKSTIAKIVSFCQWAEKRFILDGEFEYDFKDQFINFHRISETYFNKESFFQYESDFVIINHSGTKYNLEIKAKNNNIDYKKSKNIYVPAERNFVSVVPNLGKYNETNDNIMSFLYDWYDAKKNYSKKKSLSILDLGVKYYYNQDSDSDILKLQNTKKELALKNASSGLQSVIPLIMLIDYLTGDFYEENRSTSVNEEEELAKVFLKNLRSIIDNSKRLKDLQESFNTKESFSLNEKEVAKVVELMANRKDYFFTNLIIEEPEQNLFPRTQRDLIYYLFGRIVNSDRNHNLFITTHSPFILYAINNCLMGSEISSKMPRQEQLELDSHNSWINSEFVSVWQIENGMINSVIDSRTGTVTKHYFNQVLNDIMDEYYDMLNYFEYDREAEV